MKYLVDTCVVSELAHRRPDALVLEWLERHQYTDEFFISSVSIGELRKGIADLPEDDPRKPTLARWLQYQVIPSFNRHVLDYDSTVALKWGDIKGETDRAGHTRPDLDAQIAATAVAHGLILLTRNVRDMLYTGAQTCNPFEKEVAP